MIRGYWSPDHGAHGDRAGLGKARRRWPATPPRPRSAAPGRSTGVATTTAAFWRAQPSCSKQIHSDWYWWKPIRYSTRRVLGASSGAPFLRVDAVEHLADLVDRRRDLARQDALGGSGGLVLLPIRRRELVAAVRAHGVPGGDQAPALGALLGRRLAALRWWTSRIRMASTGPCRSTLPPKSRTRQFSFPSHRRKPRPTIW